MPGILFFREPPEPWPATEAPPVEPPTCVPPLPIIVWQDGPQAPTEPLQSWPLMTRVRLAIESARALLAR